MLSRDPNLDGITRFETCLHRTLPQRWSNRGTSNSHSSSIPSTPVVKASYAVSSKYKLSETSPVVDKGCVGQNRLTIACAEKPKYLYRNDKSVSLSRSSSRARVCDRSSLRASRATSHYVFLSDHVDEQSVRQRSETETVEQPDPGAGNRERLNVF
jgi:hypothetical protein